MEKLRKYNVLYVDDEESNLRVFNGLFRRKYNIHTTTSAEKALVIFDQHPFDIVISDQKMPGLSGLEFLTAIKEKNSLIPSILLTGYTDHNVLKEAFNQIGVNKYVNKPFDANSLSTIIDLSVESYLLTLERMKMQEELALSESKFRGIFNSMPDVLTRVNFNGIIEIVSPSVEELSGYKVDELVGKDAKLLYADLNERLILINKLKKLKIIRGAETTLIGKDGEKIEVSYTSKLYFDEDGNPCGVESILRNVTERKKMQSALNEKNELLDETQRLARVGSWHYDIATQKVTWSDTFSTIYGIQNFNQIETSIEGYLSFFIPSDHLRVRTIIEESVKSRENFSFEATIVRQDKKERILSVFGKLITNENNQLTKVTVACLDITDAKIRERELVKSEEKFRFLAEELPIQILKIDRKLNVIYANNLAKNNLTSLRSENGTIHSFFEKAALKNIIETINDVMANEEEGYLEFENTNRWFALNISLIKESIGLDSMLMLIHDITQKKESNRLLKNMNEELEKKVVARTEDLEKAKSEVELAFLKEKELSQLKSQFVSTASHQFRTPLTVIQSNIGLLEMQIKEAGPEFQAKFERIYPRIQSEVKRMTDLMDHVLILGKKDSGTIKPKFQMVDVLSLLLSIVDKYNDIQEDGRSVEVTHAGSVMMYHIDPELFENALSNLISNALKYSQSKPAPVVHLQFKKGSLAIKIQDFGIGIPKEDIAHIFEPFYRATNVNDIKGTGLGTSIVKAYIELIGGRIDIESTLGEGTTITVNIEK